MNSYAHYAYGAVYLWMAENIGGIRQNDVAFKKNIIKPCPGEKIKKAKCEYNSIHGKISTNWILNKKTFKLNVEIPANTTAKIYVLAKSADKVEESRKTVVKNKNLKFIEMDNKFAVFSAGSGKYKFTSSVC